MKNKAINGLIVVSVVTFLSVLAFYVRIGATADSVVVLKTSGMTCSSCSKKISDALERENGVAVTEVDVNNGWVIVSYDTKKTRPETIASRVSQAGYDSSLYRVLSPTEFRQVTGREVGKSASSGGCGGCGTNGGGCGGNRKLQEKGA